MPSLQKSFVQHLRNRNSQVTLASAINHICDVWKPVNILNIKEREQLSHESEGKIVLQAVIYGDDPIRNVVQEIHKRHRAGGLLVIDAPCLRFSAQLEQLEKHILVDEYPLTLQLETKEPLAEIPANGFTLVCDTKRSYQHLCVYVLGDCDCSPQLSNLASVLTTLLSKERFFVLGRYAIIQDEKSTNKYVRDFKVEPRDTMASRIKTAAQIWGKDLKEFDKEFESNALSEPFKATDDSRRELFAFDDNRPFSRDSERSRLRKKLLVDYRDRAMKISRR
jgi:hypothetical protein